MEKRYKAETETLYHHSLNGNPPQRRRPPVFSPALRAAGAFLLGFRAVPAFRDFSNRQEF